MSSELARIFVLDLAVSRIFCGHQPHGDAPLTINVTVSDDAEHKSGSAHESDCLQIIVADTSYSANTQWNFEPELVPKAKSGDLVLWDDDWKAIPLEVLKTQNEDRVKEDGSDEEESSVSLLDYTEGWLDADSKDPAKRKEKGEGDKVGSKAEDKDKDRAESKGAHARQVNVVSKGYPVMQAKGPTYTPTPQMLVDHEDNVAYNARPLKLWNLDAINPQLNTRGVAVSEVLIFVPHFTGCARNESVAAAEARRQQRTGKDHSRVFMHGVLSDGSTYAFEQPSCRYRAHASEDESAARKGPPQDRYIGKSTRSGAWVVKAANVIAKHNLCTTQTRHLPGAAGGDRAKGNARTKADGQSSLHEKVYLLSSGAGFTFRNKLVAASDMEEEMNS